MAGIANGVASDMTESASQVPLGCMGLDSIMGYVNKPGVHDDQEGLQYVRSPPARLPPTKRPVTYNNGFDGMFSDMYGIGAVIGMSDAENEARAKKLGEEIPDSAEDWLNQLLVRIDLGMKDHKGLYAWCHSHIPTVREAIATGEPYKPRVWFDMSGNKLAMLGNAKSWYERVPRGGLHHRPVPDAHLLPHRGAPTWCSRVREWLEEPMVNMTQLDTQWLQNECVHIGETVSHSIPAAQVVEKCARADGEATFPAAWSSARARPTWAAPPRPPSRQGVADTLRRAPTGTSCCRPMWTSTCRYVTPASDYWKYNQHEDRSPTTGCPRASAPSRARWRRTARSC